MLYLIYKIYTKCILFLYNIYTIHIKRSAEGVLTAGRVSRTPVLPRAGRSGMQEEKKNGGQLL